MARAHTGGSNTRYYRLNGTQRCRCVIVANNQTEDKPKCWGCGRAPAGDETIIIVAGRQQIWCPDCRTRYKLPEVNND